MTRGPSSPDQTATGVTRALQQLATPQKAKASAWFFKTGTGQYGEGDEFIGVTVPEQRRVARQFKHLPLGQIKLLLYSPLHECRLTALLILVDQFERALKEIPGLTRRVQPGKFVEFYLAHRDRVNNWDLVDSSAAQILGAWLLERREHLGSGSANGRRLLRGGGGAGVDRVILYEFARSQNLWDRRIAMIATYAFIKAGQFDDVLKIAEILVHDSHNLIQKAVGWMLREIGNRNRKIEETFLDRHAAAMPRTMLRYAIEKFSPERRAHYLSLARERRSATKQRSRGAQ